MLIRCASQAQAFLGELLQRFAQIQHVVASVATMQRALRAYAFALACQAEELERLLWMIWTA
jgi:hypothetical protein